jgi:hypothetical protein
MSNWITRTMENMDQLLAAVKFDPGKGLSDFDPAKPSETDKQMAYVNSSLERCRRCGDHTYLLVPAGMSTLCNECESDLRVMENESLKATPHWFYEMVRIASDKAKGAKT